MRLSNGTELEKMSFDDFTKDTETLKEDIQSNVFLNALKQIETLGNFEQRSVDINKLAGVVVSYRYAPWGYVTIKFNADETKNTDMFRRLTDDLWFVRFLRTF